MIGLMKIKDRQIDRQMNGLMKIIDRKMNGLMKIIDRDRQIEGTH